jgi:hypothetical protein
VDSGVLLRFRRESEVLITVTTDRATNNLAINLRRQVFNHHLPLLGGTDGDG